MTEQEEFFSPNHNRLLNIATWARYLAWVVFVVYILWAIGTYIQQQNTLQYYKEFRNVPPFYSLSTYMESLGVFLKGVVCFLVLKGISLGLNMIVETDVNYREQKGETK
jgi:hypothetical protein